MKVVELATQRVIPTWSFKAIDFLDEIVDEDDSCGSRHRLIGALLYGPYRVSTQLIKALNLHSLCRPPTKCPATCEFTRCLYFSAAGQDLQSSYALSQSNSLILQRRNKEGSMYYGTKTS